MKTLLKNKKIQIIWLVILIFSVITDFWGGHFFHEEMTRQINETLASQAVQIMKGYDTYDQNMEILRAGIQADALELNRIHGEFLLQAMAQTYRQNLRGELSQEQLKHQIGSILQRSEAGISLKGSLIWDASSHRNDLDRLIRDTVQDKGQYIRYVGNDPSEVFHSGALDVVIRGGSEQPWETYGRAVYYQPLDVIVVFEGTSSYAEDNVGRLFRRNQENLERNIRTVGTMEDVIIFQKSGYSFYSGRFEKDSTRRVTRILYNDMNDPEGLGKEVAGSHGTYKTLMVPTPYQELQERYCYIVHDTHQDQYIVVSRPTEEIEKREDALNMVSRLVGALNVIVICFIAYMLVSRDETLKEEGMAP